MKLKDYNPRVIQIVMMVIAIIAEKYSKRERMDKTMSHDELMGYVRGKFLFYVDPHELLIRMVLKYLEAGYEIMDRIAELIVDQFDRYTAKVVQVEEKFIIDMQLPVIEGFVCEYTTDEMDKEII